MWRFIYCYAECSYDKCRYGECHYAECRYAECRYAECHYAECCYAECRYAECHYAECHYAECRYAECRYAEYCGADTAAKKLEYFVAVNYFQASQIFENQTSSLLSILRGSTHISSKKARVFVPAKNYYRLV